MPAPTTQQPSRPKGSTVRAVSLHAAIVASEMNTHRRCNDRATGRIDAMPSGRRTCRASAVNACRWLATLSHPHTSWKGPSHARTRYTTIIPLEGEHGPRGVAARGGRAGEPHRRVRHAGRLRPRRLARAGAARRGRPAARGGGRDVAGRHQPGDELRIRGPDGRLARRGSARACRRHPAEAQLHRGRQRQEGPVAVQPGPGAVPGRVQSRRRRRGRRRGQACADHAHA